MGKRSRRPRWDWCAGVSPSNSLNRNSDQLLSPLCVLLKYSDKVNNLSTLISCRLGWFSNEYMFGNLFGESFDSADTVQCTVCGWQKNSTGSASSPTRGLKPGCTSETLIWLTGTSSLPLFFLILTPMSPRISQ